VDRDRLRGGLGGTGATAADAVFSGQRGGIWIEPEADLAVTLLDERSDPVGERL
jgi:hypothetical protein